MMMSKLVRVTAVAVALSFAPATAFAVSVSANDGNGSQSRTKSYGNGASVSGNLRSTGGQTVFYSGKVALGNFCSDQDTGRYASNTSSPSYVTRGGDIATLNAGTCPVQGVKSRVCTVKNNRPDLCGSDSSTY